MDPQIIFKFVVLFLLLLILISLASGMFFLIKDKGGKTRTLNSLKFRIGLSILLFVLLLVGFKMGWVTPHSLPHESPKIQKAP